MSRLQPRTPIAATPLLGEAPQHKQSASIPLRIFASCLTSVIVAVHYTNYGPLIPTLIGDLHITGGQAGLLSTFLFLGLAVMYIRTFGLGNAIAAWIAVYLAYQYGVPLALAATLGSVALLTGV